jgi:hypothetical protein
VLSPTPAEQIRDEAGNPGMAQTPRAAANASVASNAGVDVAASRSGNRWRYRWHNNNWWYWTPENRWVYRNGNEWINYEAVNTAVPDARYTSQAAYGNYQSSPNGYYPGPYRYSTGFRGDYGPVYQGGYYPGPYRYSTGYRGDYGPVYQSGDYYGSGGYYGQPGISLGFGFGRGLRVRF